MFTLPCILPVCEVSARAQQESGGAAPEVSAAEERIVNPGESFLGKAAEKCRKEAFFGQRMLPLSVTLESPSVKVPPRDGAPLRQPSARGRAGEVGGCARGRRLRAREKELFRPRRSLIKLLKL